MNSDDLKRKLGIDGDGTYRVDPETGRVQKEGFFGWQNTETRVEPGSGTIQKDSLFGWQNTDTRINPNSGVVQQDGLFGHTDTDTRVNPGTGIVQRDGLFGWRNGDERINPETGQFQGRGLLNWEGHIRTPVSGGGGSGASISHSGANKGLLGVLLAFFFVAILGGFFVSGASNFAGSFFERLISYTETVLPSIFPASSVDTPSLTDNSQKNPSSTALLESEAVSVAKESVKPDPIRTQSVSGLSEPEPISQPSPLCPRPEACITFPSQNAQLSGVVAFRGTANKPDFQYYKFEYKPEANREWNFLTRFERPVSNGVVLEWDTGTVPSGAYHLRLMVVDKTGNYWPEFAEIRVVVQN